VNADGRADLVFRNTGSGAATVWHSTGEGFLSNVGYIGSVDLGWELVGQTGMNPNL
jgi:hypothetical protein